MREAAYRFVLRAAGRKRYKLFREIKDIPHLPPEEIARIQLSRLKTMLTHAADNVPYYRDLFDETGLQPESLASVEQLSQLPTLERQTVRTQIDSLVTRDLDRRRLLRWSTGGSTGAPVDFYKDVEYYELEMALMWRSWSWAGWNPSDKMVWVWGAPTETSQLTHLRGRLKWSIGGKLLLDAFDMTDEKLERWVEEINRFGAEHVIGYASALAHFAKFILSHGIDLKPRFKQIISTAEKLTETQRKLIEDAFRAKVCDQYGCREIRLTAFECSRRNMHVISDSVVMEFLEDPSVHTGARKIVCTALNNLAMPLIRYELGDYGAPLEDECSCGINFPLMKMDIGRISDNFVTPGGRVVHGEYFTHLMYGISGVGRFQFYQNDPALIRLYVVLDNPDQQASVEKQLEAVRDAVRGLGTGVDLRIEFKHSIDTTRSGKHRFTVCDLTND
jgi:phenylacetate-CoA ligase